MSKFASVFLLGFEGNAVEKARFRRQLEEKIATDLGTNHQDTVVAKEEQVHAMPEENTTYTHHDHHAHGSTHKPEPEPINAGNTHHHTGTINQAEQVRKMLVNNYRPVQPLNGRTVYRSFPFFGETKPSDTEVVYLDMDSSEQKNRGDCYHSSSPVRVMSLVTMVCSFVLFTLL